MKISILTLTHNQNFGAAMQCYALSNYLSEKGHEITILNVKRDFYDKVELSFFQKIKRKIRNKVISIYQRNTYLDKISDHNKVKFISQDREEFMKFYSEYLPSFTTQCSSSDEMIKNLPPSDLFIVGSDQVWNPKCTRSKMMMYFFPFLSNQACISYAASMGGTEDVDFNGKESEIHSLLSKFNSISVRDNTTYNILKNRFNIDCVKVCDPSFLLNAETYRKIASESKLDGRGCLYSFYFGYNKLWYDNIKFLSKELGIKPRVDWSKEKFKGLPYNPVISIPDWLKLISSSDFVYTNSFHGVVFSIIFRKQFIVTPSYQGGIGRIKTLLGELGLSSRLYENPNDIAYNIDLIKKKINYDEVYIKLNKIRQFSSDYLNDQLQELQKR